MSFEWIGAATLVAGIICLFDGRRFAIFALVLSTLLGAATASVLTFLGSANLPPSHLLFGFVVLIAARRHFLGRVLASYAWPNPGWWLLFTLIYALIVTLFMPRILAGWTDVFTIARTDSGGSGLLLTPLGPVSGNITQTVYFIGDVVCFGIFQAFAGDRDGKRWLAGAFIACGFVDILFAALDYLTYYTQTADYLSFMRNATYRMLDTAEVVGVKRLVGSFPEASAFATATLTLFAFSSTLWLNSYRPRTTGPLALLLLATLILSTSATAYVSLTLYLAIVYLVNGWSVLSRSHDRTRYSVLALGPILLGLGIGAVLLDAKLSSGIQDLLDQLIFQKGNTDSAAERGSWNSQALVNFIDSYGIGIGIGSARASNFLLAALANIGIIGTVAYGVFILACLRAPSSDSDETSRTIRSAAAFACLSLVISGSLAGTTIDLGLLFFICAGLATSSTYVGVPATPSGAPARRTHAPQMQKGFPPPALNGGSEATPR